MGEFLLNLQRAVNMKQAQAYNLMTLARNRALLEQHRPDSQRKALALIAEAKTPKPIAAAPTTTSDQRTAAAERQIELVKGEALLSETMKVRFDKALKKAIDVALRDMQESFDEEVRKQLAEHLKPERERLKEAEAEAIEDRTHYLALSQGVAPLISDDEFKLIRGCLHPDRAPAERRDRFNDAFLAINKLAPYFEKLRMMEKRKQEQSERSKAMWANRKAAEANAEAAA